MSKGLMRIIRYHNSEKIRRRAYVILGDTFVTRNCRYAFLGEASNDLAVLARTTPLGHLDIIFVPAEEIECEWRK